VEIPVVVYTNQPVAELFLNGRSLGEKTMGEKMQLLWKVPYSPGELKVVASKNGKEVRNMSYQTAGKPAVVRITTDRKWLRSGSADVAHLTLEVTDAAGVPVPDAANRLTFDVTGPGELIGLENGDILDLDPHKITSRKLFSGKLLALVQAVDEVGEINIRVSGEGLEAASIALHVN
jgi:beta-galactosidase